MGVEFARQRVTGARGLAAVPAPQKGRKDIQVDVCGYPSLAAHFGSI